MPFEYLLNVYTIHWFLVYSELCNHHHTNFRPFSLPITESLQPLAVTAQVLGCLQPWPPQIWFLPLWRCLFWTFHVHGTAPTLVQCLPTASGVRLSHLGVGPRPCLLFRTSPAIQALVGVWTVPAIAFFYERTCTSFRVDVCFHSSQVCF
jgi:hypothetical protein